MNSICKDKCKWYEETLNDCPFWQNMFRPEGCVHFEDKDKEIERNSSTL